MHFWMYSNLKNFVVSDFIKDCFGGTPLKEEV